MTCQTLAKQQEHLEELRRKKKQKPQGSTERKVVDLRAKRRGYVYARRKMYPWERKYESAKARCENSRTEMYPQYGGRGIKMLMTKDDFKFLWERDKACLMKKPSIDRKNNDGNYELLNCRFIELDLNVSLAKRIAIKRIAEDGSIKIYPCINRALEEFGGSSTGNISSCARGRRKTAFGFRWEYLKEEASNGQ